MFQSYCRRLGALVCRCGQRTLVYFVGHDELVVTDSPGMLRWRKLIVLFLSNNSQFAGASFGIPPTRLMEVGGQVEI